MRDVAERAGVSITTVSHVINETRPVSDGLRQRVQAAMRELGYQHNLLARGLRRGETRTVGMIVPDSANPFFAELARGIEVAVFKQGYNVILCNSDGDLDKELLHAVVLAEKQVDGILFVAAGGSTEHIQALLRQRMPVVVVDREVAEAAVDSVLTDNARGGWLATRHLLELGHRRIGCITGPSDVTPSAERITGYRQAMSEAGVLIDQSLIVRGDFQYDSGYQAARRLLSMDDSLTAIFACNDLMAIGAISGTLDMGRRVPTDISIVGFDDVALASFANPALTTVDQPKHEMGMIAATMLLERVRNPGIPPRRTVLKTELRVRRSTASAGCIDEGWRDPACEASLPGSGHSACQGVRCDDRRIWRP